MRLVTYLNRIYCNDIMTILSFYNENNAAWLADGGRRPGWKPYNGGRWGLPEGAINTYR